MIVSLKLVGGDWHKDDGLIWSGDMPHPELLHQGSVISLHIANIKTTLKINMVAAEISQERSDMEAEVRYVFYVAGLTESDSKNAKVVGEKKASLLVEDSPTNYRGVGGFYR